MSLSELLLYIFRKYTCSEVCLTYVGFRDFVIVELLDIIENMHVLSFARPTLCFSAIAE